MPAVFFLSDSVLFPQGNKKGAGQRPPLFLWWLNSQRVSSVSEISSFRGYQKNVFQSSVTLDITWM
jgi:hypothetical protein